MHGRFEPALWRRYDELDIARIDTLVDLCAGGNRAVTDLQRDPIEASVADLHDDHAEPWHQHLRAIASVLRAHRIVVVIGGIRGGVEQLPRASEMT